MMSYWQNLRIGVRLALGIGLVLVLLVVVAGASYLGLTKGNGNFSDYRLMARQTSAAGVMNDHLNSARLSVKDFLLKNTDESVRNVEAALARLREEIDRSRGLFAGSADEMRKIEDVLQAADSYKAAFAKAVAFRQQRDDFVVQMNENGPVTESHLTNVMNASYQASDPVAAYRACDALRASLMARVYANKFLNENQVEHAEETKAHLKDFDGKVGLMLAELDSADHRSQSQAALTATNNYAVAFEGAYQAILARNEIVNNELNKIGPSIEAALDQLMADNKAEQDTLGPKASASMQQSLTIAIVISAIAIAMGVFVGYMIARSITRPIGGMTLAMGGLANGDFAIEVPAQNRKDEIGLMAKAVQVFKDNMIKARALDAEAKDAQAKQIERGHRMEDAVTNFDKAIGEVVEAVNAAATELQATAQNLSATAEETSRQSSAVAAASEETTQNVQTVASATEELTASISEIGSQVSESTRIVGDAVTQAEDTDGKVKKLAEAAQKIGDVVTLINAIAGQTNLLALNATIEAARAGEAGKGFAVVASEVKNLATQTAKATEDITGQVREIQDSTESSARAIRDITGTIRRVSDISTTIAAAVEEQGAATQEISRNVQQAAAGTAEVATNITGVTEAAQQTSAGSAQVLSAATELAVNGARLKREVDLFLDTVRRL
jgi:methyl-accepting chemotaxis protein